MNFATISNLSKSYGIRSLFKNVNFIVNEGESMAIVAKNGSGKSTLLNIICGRDTAEQGSVEILKDVQVFMFEQSDNFNENQTVKDVLYNHSHPVLEVVKQYDEFIKNNISDDRLIDCMGKMDDLNAWSLEQTLEEILTNLKIDFLNQKIEKLSGGQRKRVSLAKFLIDISLFEGHQLLILDEPTNHLDIEMVEWLEYFLNKESRTLLLVTHDRYFLDAICTEILELEDQQIYVHKGNYETYVTNKAIRLENQQASIDKAQNLYRKELEWMRRQPKARTTKSKSREDRFYDTEKVAKQKIVNKSVLLEMQMSRLGNKIIELKNISKSFGEKKILDNYSYIFSKGQKIGIIGKNGVGKSTFLKILEGNQKVDSGEIERGDTLVFGHFTQDGISYKEDQRVIDFVTDIAEYFPLANGKTMSASQFLQLFLFEPQQQYTHISKLSGGEKKRLQLLSVLFKNPNFLILDEPTNDLDLPTLTVLENFLKEYQGCVLIVSHDRYFMDKVVEELLIFEGEGKIGNYIGTYTEYFLEEESKKNLKNNVEIIEKNEPKETEKKITQKLSFKEQKELDELTKNLPKLEKKKAELELKMSQTDLNIEQINSLSKEFETISKTITENEFRWLELSEK